MTRVTAGLVVASWFLTFPSSSSAQVAPSIFIEEPARAFQNVAIPFDFQTNASQPRSSVCCTALSDDLDPEFTAVTRLGTFGGPISFSTRGGIAPQIPSNSNGVSAAEGARACFISEAGSRFQLTVNRSNVTPGSTFADLAIHCDETSLYGGYNTVVTELNYLEIVNTTVLALNAHLYGYDASSGDLVIDATITLPGGAGPRRTDIDLHSLVGQGKFGSLVLAHDGPKGAVKADVAQYRITTLIPFDFDLVARNPLNSRQTQ